MTFSGNELAAFEGVFRGFSENGEQFAVYSAKDQRSRFYTLSGESTELSLKGDFQRIFSRPTVPRDHRYQ